MVYLAELCICITFCFKIVRLYAQSVPCVHGHQRLDDDATWLIAASTIDWSNCAYSVLTKIQTKNYVQVITFSVEYSSIEYLNHKIIKSCGALRRIDDANASNLILIITALCNNLEHLRLTWYCFDVN